MTRRKVRAIVGAAAVAVTGLGIVLPGSASGAASSGPAIAGNVFPASGNPIQHVIVVIQSGHSFDNYFGTRPGADGIPATAKVPVAPGSTSYLQPYHLQADQARDGLRDTLRVTQKAIDGGKMDGFISAQPNSSIGSVAMGHYERSDLPYYWNLADRFTLFDQFYASSQAGSLPNRLVAVSGQTDGVASNRTLGPGVVVPGGTVFDQLNTQGLTWKYYAQGYQPGVKPTKAQITRDPLLVMPSIVGNPANAARLVSTSQYFVDLDKGQLPAVSYITAATSDSERSPQDPAQGEAFVRSLINALMQSSEWSHTALLLTYDDSGGWYDHSVPPTVAGTTLGIRVPTLLISPYAKPGYVDHTTLDTASIPGFIDSVFNLPPITPQVSQVGSVMTAVDTSQQPVSPIIGPSEGTLASIPRPKVQAVYILYLGALLVAALFLMLAFLRQRRSAGPVAATGGGGPVPLPGMETVGTTPPTKRSRFKKSSRPGGERSGPAGESPPHDSPSGKILSGQSAAPSGTER